MTDIHLHTCASGRTLPRLWYLWIAAPAYIGNPLIWWIQNNFGMERQEARRYAKLLSRWFYSGYVPAHYMMANYKEKEK